MSTVITDSSGNSLDLAGDWAVFQDSNETKFTHFIHYDQTSETSYSVTENTVFMLDYDQGRESLPIYENGRVDKPRSVFLRGGTTPLIYKDGRIHIDFREFYIGYGLPYGLPEMHVVIDENTLSYEDQPEVRLRRITTFKE